VLLKRNIVKCSLGIAGAIRDSCRAVATIVIVAPPALGRGLFLKKTMKRMKELIITAAVSVITGLAGWIAGRRKNVALTQSVELDNIEKAVEIWRKLAESYAEKLQGIQADINKISVENDKLKQSVDRLSDENDKLKAEIDGLRKKIATLNCDNKRLGKKFEEYSQTNITDNDKV
jgi:septal ring factor EnvC (AmiA/AmiB activator)